MKKKLLPLIMTVALMAGILAGCGQEEVTTGDANVSSENEVVVEAESEQIQDSASENADVSTETESVVKGCSLCEKDVVCNTYEVDGVTYIVCDSCYEEFAHGMQIPSTCSLCERSVYCMNYEVDGATYVVCDDCYGEFATAFNILSYCSQCTQDKICGHYMVDGLPYSVCDDCYAKFAQENGLPQH